MGHNHHCQRNGEKEEEVEDLSTKRDDMIGAWTGFLVVTIIMITLAFALFDGWVSWMWLAEMGTFIGGTVTTIEYFKF